MRAMTALVEREFYEHRGAFLYAPIVLLIIMTVAILFAMLSGRAEFDLPPTQIPLGDAVYRVAVGGAFLIWSVYLIVGLFFYYADSFSADRRNNTLLFWKSMPQSDLRILTSKALAGITIFLALISVFAIVTAIIIYGVLLIASSLFPVITAPDPIGALWNLFQTGIVGVFFLALTVLWYAPGLAWVAGLSTLFRRWSIPLAFLIPGTVILLEYLNTIRSSVDGRPVADYLGWRFEGFVDQTQAFTILFGQNDNAPFALLRSILADIDWMQMGIGLVFTAVVVYLASEYRRRRIEA